MASDKTSPAYRATLLYNSRVVQILTAVAILVILFFSKDFIKRK
jgi:hypothetical protein